MIKMCKITIKQLQKIDLYYNLYCQIKRYIEYYYSNLSEAVKSLHVIILAWLNYYIYNDLWSFNRLKL